MGWPFPRENNLDHGTHHQEKDVMDPPKWKVSEMSLVALLFVAFHRIHFQIWFSNLLRHERWSWRVLEVYSLVTYCPWVSPLRTYNLDGADSHHGRFLRVVSSWCHGKTFWESRKTGCFFNLGGLYLGVMLQRCRTRAIPCIYRWLRWTMTLSRDFTLQRG